MLGRGRAHNEYRQEDGSDFGLKRLSATFRQPERERAFQRHHLPQMLAQLRIALSVCACFYVAFALSDVAVLGYTDKTLELFLARLLVAIAAAIGIFVLARHPQSITVPRVVATTVEVVGMAAFMLVLVHRPHEVPWHAMSMSIMLVVVLLFIPNSFVNATAVSVVTTVVFSVLVIHVGTLSISDMLTMTMLLVLVNTVGIIAAHRFESLGRQQFRTQSNLRHLSFRDHLTGCFNRRFLEEHLLEQEVERASRYPAWLTVIMCDLDHFKSINDTYGHQTGDIVLQHFAGILQAACRDHIDSVIRYGGEEFVLILPETDLNGGIHLAERLRRAIADTPAYYDGERTVGVTASFGVVAADFSAVGLGGDPKLLITRADELLYRAKNAGRNRVEHAELVRAPKAA